MQVAHSAFWPILQCANPIGGSRKKKVRNFSPSYRVIVMVTLTWKSVIQRLTLILSTHDSLSNSRCS